MFKTISLTNFSPEHLPSGGRTSGRPDRPEPSRVWAHQERLGRLSGRDIGSRAAAAGTSGGLEQNGKKKRKKKRPRIQQSDSIFLLITLWLGSRYGMEGLVGASSFPTDRDTIGGRPSLSRRLSSVVRHRGRTGHGHCGDRASLSSQDQ